MIGQDEVIFKILVGFCSSKNYTKVYIYVRVAMFLCRIVVKALYNNEFLLHNLLHATYIFF